MSYQCEVWAWNNIKALKNLLHKADGKDITVSNMKGIVSPFLQDETRAYSMEPNQYVKTKEQIKRQYHVSLILRHNSIA